MKLPWAQSSHKSAYPSSVCLSLESESQKVFNLLEKTLERNFYLFSIISFHGTERFHVVPFNKNCKWVPRFSMTLSSILDHSKGYRPCQAG